MRTAPLTTIRRATGVLVLAAPPARNELLHGRRFAVVLAAPPAQGERLHGRVTS